MKMIVFDLDGTLLNSKDSISDFNKNAISTLNKEDLILVIATGRHLSDVINLEVDFFRSNINYYICCDGMYIYDKQLNLIIENKLLSNKDINLIINSVRLNSILIITPSDNFLATESAFRFLKHKFRNYIFNDKTIPVLYKNINNYNFDRVEKVIIPTNPDLSQFVKMYTVHKRQLNKKGYEITTKNATKYDSILKLASSLMIKKEDILFFGDDYNDEECFINLTETVAMANTPEYLKRIAKYVTESNDKNGVGLFLNTLFEK